MADDYYDDFEIPNQDVLICEICGCIDIDKEGKCMGCGFYVGL